MSPSSYSIAHGEAIPQELKARRQWANWRDDKVIRNSRTGKNGSSTDCLTWSTFSQAVKADPDRLVFVFSPDDDFVGIDLDGCRNAETGELDARATALVERFPGVYWEISLSGTGLHGIGRGALPDDATGRHPQGIGIFDRGRYFVMTGNVLPGHETLGDFGDDLAAFYREVSPDKPKRPASAAPSSTLTLDDNDVIKRLNREPGGKAARLLVGDADGYPDYSTARFALATKISFYTDDVDQVARVIRSSGLFKDADSERERDRKAALDARNAVDQYDGPRYDPDYGYHAPLPMIVPPIAVGATCAEQLTHAQDTIVLLTAQLQDARQTITVREGVIVRERELRKAAEARAERLAETNSKTLQILKNPDLSIGPKVTTFAVILDLGARIANGEAPTEHGYRVPAVRIAEMTGQSEDTVARHLRKVDHLKLIPKRIVREPAHEVCDRGSGEITVAGTRDANYIPVPEGNVISLIDRIIGYQRPELETGHGGVRNPQCPDHPEAGTVKRWTIECAECHQSLDSGETYQAPRL